MEDQGIRPIGIAVTLIVGLLIGAGGVYLYFAKKSPSPNQESCLTITSPKPNETVTFPLTVEGSVQWGCKWTIFEGNAGGVAVVQNDIVLGGTYLSTEGKEYGGESAYPIAFTGTIQSLEKPYVSGPAQLMFTDDDPCGEDPECPPDPEPVVVPIILSAGAPQSDGHEDSMGEDIDQEIVTTIQGINNIKLGNVSNRPPKCNYVLNVSTENDPVRFPFNISVTFPYDENCSWVTFEGYGGLAILQILEKGVYKTIGYSVMSSGFDSYDSKPKYTYISANIDPKYDDPPRTYILPGYEAIAGDGRIVLIEDREAFDTSGDEYPADRPMFVIPVTFNTIPQGMMTVKAFFGNKVLANDPNYINCDIVFPITRTTTATQQIARAAVEELFKGLTATERVAGYSTGWYQGVTVNSLSITNGTANLDLDFDPAVGLGPGGACGTTAMLSQLNATLKQFPTVQDVEITINGQPSEETFESMI